MIYVLGMAVLAALCAPVGCSEDNDWVDDHKLNPALIGTWGMTHSGGAGYDGYVIDNSNAIIHYEKSPESKYEGTTYPATDTTTNYTIEYIYNFNSNKTAGGIIVKDTSNKFTAVWFNDLKPQKSVCLGAAITVADYSVNPAVDTLEAAKTKFSLANAALYGGASANTASPQQWGKAKE